MRFLTNDEHFIFSPCIHQEKYPRIQLSTLDFFTQPLNYPRNVPSWQCPSPWLLPANSPPSPPLPSPPPSPMLSSSQLPVAHSDLPPGSFLTPAAVQSRRQLPRWFSSWYILSQWTGRASRLPPRICQLLLLAPCLGHRWHQFVYCVRSFTKTSKGDTEFLVFHPRPIMKVPSLKVSYV